MFTKATETSILSKIFFFFFAPEHDCDHINDKGKKKKKVIFFPPLVTR